MSTLSRPFAWGGGEPGTANPVIVFHADVGIRFRCARSRVHEGPLMRAAISAPPAFAPNARHARTLAVVVRLALVLAWAAPAARAQWLPQGTPVDVQNGNHHGPRVVADGAGGAFVAWQHPSPGAKLRLQHLDALGAPVTGWPVGGIPVTSGLVPQALAGVGPDGSGGIVLGWVEGQQLRAVCLAPDGTPVVGWAAGGNVLLTLSSGPNHVELISGFTADLQGGAWFTQHVSDQPCPDICYTGSAEYLYHVASTGAVDPSHPGVAGSNFAFGAGAGIGALAAGQALVVGTNGPAQTGTLHRYSSANGFAWSASIGPGNLNVLAMDDDGAGGAIAATMAAFNVIPPRVLRRDATGGVPLGWPETGVPIRIPEVAPVELTGTGDGADGMLVFWSEAAGPRHDLRMQRVLASGSFAPGWPTAGVLVNAASGYHDQLRISADGTGGAFVAWRDRRADAEGDIFAARVLGNGTLDPAFPPNGTAVAMLTGRQAGLSLATVSTGQAIVAWEDSRDAANRVIYAQRLPVPGTLDVAPRSAEVSFAGFVPNPSRTSPHVACELPRASDATLELFDVAGRLVHRETFIGLAPGPHRLPLAQALSPGLYLLRLRAAGHVRTARGLITR